MFKQLQFLAASAALSLSFTVAPLAAAQDDGKDDDSLTFSMVVSAGAKACLPNASAKVTITPAGPVEFMDVTVQGLPANKEFDFFVIQVPKAPFGVSWYQGDIEKGPFPDASLNPPFNPLQMYHLGIWFGSPETAAAAGVSRYRNSLQWGAQCRHSGVKHQQRPGRPRTVAEGEPLKLETVGPKQLI